MLISVSMLAGCGPERAPSATRLAFDVGELPALPRGVGGPFSGIVGDDLVVAGGGYFLKPPTEGGTKIYTDEILALAPRAPAWRRVGKLDRPLAYGAAISTPKGLVLAGGSDERQHFDTVHLLTHTNGQIHLTALPSLPHPVAQLEGACLGSTIYVAGGREGPETPEALRSFWALDLDRVEQGWQVLDPWPGPARTLPLVAAQAGGVYVITGAELLPGDDAQPARRYLTDGYRYQPGKGWKRIADLPHAAVAAPVAAWGSDRILVFGGDDGHLAAHGSSLGDTHPGFNRALLCYDTCNDTWSTIQELPPLMPVTTHATVRGGEVLIPSGEDKPGHRTPGVYRIRLRKESSGQNRSTGPVQAGRAREAVAKMTSPTRYPAFTWDRVAVTAHLGKPSGPFTDEEAQFLAANFPLIAIEKTQGMNTPLAGEQAMRDAARQLKRLNPDARVLFYWNVFLDYPMYEAHETFAAHPEWALIDREGKPVLVRGRVPTYDLSNPDVRAWWSDVASRALTDAPFDGVFIDALPKIGMVEHRSRQVWGPEKYEAVEAGLRQMLTLTRGKLGPEALMIYNGLRGALDQWPDGGARYMSLADGAMVEHFGAYSGRDDTGRIVPAMMAADIHLIREAGLAGKIVVVKGWPDFKGLPADADHETKVRRARETITFPLAVFLVAAEKYAYFAYSWGYQDTDGWFEWYPEFDRSLGPPRGPATREGWQYRREFEHASVWIDIENEKAEIDWR